MYNLQAKIHKKLENSQWNKIIGDLILSKRFTTTLDEIKNIKDLGNEITPKGINLFRAFELCPFNKLKVVIIGMDPYPQPGVANGVAFCCKDSKKIEKSLKFINQDMSNVYGIDINNKDLTFIAEQGVLLLNSALTCTVGRPGSHLDKWLPLMSDIVNRIVENNRDVIFVLMGKKSHYFTTLLPPSVTIFLISHPASAAYKGGKWDSDGVWRKINDELEKRNKKEIKWNLE